MIPEVSIIIVHYKAKPELFACLSSIISSKPKTAYEAIVVDNDETETIQKQLIKKFPSVKYVRTLGNIGFGAGNNLGAQLAQGKYLFFLNPDTLLVKGTIDQLVQSLKIERKIGITTPQILDKKMHIYPNQCSATLTPLSGLIAHSIVNRIFPNNPVSNIYWIRDWDRKTRRKVEVVQGAALLVKKKLYDKIGGFDEQLFMYFEESDFCLRARREGWSIVFEPKAKIIHLSERSTKDKKKALSIFRTSRAYYFRKHFGLVKGRLTQALFWLLDRWKVILILLFAGIIIILVAKA